MKDYLKMADAFESSCNVPVFNDDEMYCGDSFIAEFNSRKSALMAAHAINSHDELVQMLAVMAELVGKMNCYCHQAGASANKNSENPVESWMAEAAEALHAIRSES